MFRRSHGRLKAVLKWGLQKGNSVFFGLFLFILGEPGGEMHRRFMGLEDGRCLSGDSGCRHGGEVPLGASFFIPILEQDTGDGADPILQSEILDC